MFRKTILVALVVFVASSAWSQGSIPKSLTIEAVGVNSCVASGIVAQGQQIRLTGGGFTPGATIDLAFGCCDSLETSLGSTIADPSGAIDATVLVPTVTGTPTLPALAMIEATAFVQGTGYISGFVTIGPASGGDGDIDGVPDFCDNCPSIGNAGQEDTDTDGIGDVCDSCLSDFLNDVDGDGICGNVDGCPFDADNDLDGDGVCGDSDNCPSVLNPSQLDTDENGIGDACQTLPTCSDGEDNDADGFTDFPSDTGCADAADTTETDLAMACDDGIDNDADALTDFNASGTRDPGCGRYQLFAVSENPECDNGIDDDLDGFIDWDGNLGLSAPDPDCQGFGFGTSETVPEPSFGFGLGLGFISLCFFRGHTRNRRSIPIC